VRKPFYGHDDRNNSQPKIRQTECFIGGHWVPAASGKTFETINPATEEVIASVAEGTPRHRSRGRSGPKAMRGPWGKMDARDRGD